jgi:hypothetical protein
VFLFLQSAVFFGRNFALLQNLKITYDKPKGVFFISFKTFTKKKDKKALLDTFKLCASKGR